MRAGIRTGTTLVVETAEAREVHHFALLVGYGATAVNPYLAFETLEVMAGSDLLEGVGVEARKNYVKAIGKGLLKVISKMGISTLFSYCGAQIFEAVGLNQEVIDRYFTGTASRVGGVGLEEIEREVLERHRRAFSAVEDGPEELEVGGSTSSGCRVSTTSGTRRRSHPLSAPSRQGASRPSRSSPATSTSRARASPHCAASSSSRRTLYLSKR